MVNILSKSDESVSKLLEQLSETINAAGGQLPDVANQLIEYGIMVNSFMAVMFLILAILAGVFAAKTHDMVRCIFILLIAIMALAAVERGMKLIKAYTAPKVYVIDSIVERLIRGR